jgi:FdhD protein
VIRGDDGGMDEDWLAREEPLEIRVEDRSLAVTMRTPGDDLDLAAGFLLGEGVVDGADDLLALDHLPGDAARNTVVARLAGGVAAHAEAIERATRALFATSACGICGKASLDRVRVLAPQVRARFAPDLALVRSLPERLREAQSAFEATGGLHGAALFTPDGALEVVREDIGRHNAVDKVLGWRLRADRVPVDDVYLVVSGRLGFEIVQKARVAGVSVVVGLGAASDLAVDLARDGSMALFGFVRTDRYTRYC